LYIPFGEAIGPLKADFSLSRLPDRPTAQLGNHDTLQGVDPLEAVTKLLGQRGAEKMSEID
jgi:hypothetical protein